VGVQQPQRSGLVIAIVLGLLGLVWIAQGLGVRIGNSFMIGDLRWTAAGLALVAVAILLGVRRFRRS
jgi:VIT1/CCC1 family predicted Fe2+/Mn2+ transporter